MTELETLKKKKKDGKATPEDLTRLKLLLDGEPLSKEDLEKARKKEADRAAADKTTYETRKEETATANVTTTKDLNRTVSGTTSQYKGKIAASQSLDTPPEHPRIVKLKEALLPFTKIEAHDSRPDEFVLFTRDASITAGDVRKARKAMTL